MNAAIEEGIVRRYGLKPGRKNNHCQEFVSERLSNELARVDDKAHLNSRTWWRAMDYDEFSHLQTHMVPKEADSGQFLSPLASYANSYMSNNGTADYLVSFTYYGQGSLVDAIKKEFASMSKSTKDDWEKGEGVKSRISNINKNNRWDVNFKAESGIASIGTGTTGKNPFFTTVFQDFIARGGVHDAMTRGGIKAAAARPASNGTYMARKDDIQSAVEGEIEKLMSKGLIKWRLEKMLSRHHRDPKENKEV